MAGTRSFSGIAVVVLAPLFLAACDLFGEQEYRDRQYGHWIMLARHSDNQEDRIHHYTQAAKYAETRQDPAHRWLHHHYLTQARTAPEGSQAQVNAYHAAARHEDRNGPAHSWLAGHHLDQARQARPGSDAQLAAYRLARQFEADPNGPAHRWMREWEADEYRRLLAAASQAAPESDEQIRLFRLARDLEGEGTGPAQAWLNQRYNAHFFIGMKSRSEDDKRAHFTRAAKYERAGGPAARWLAQNPPHESNDADVIDPVADCTGDNQFLPECY